MQLIYFMQQEKLPSELDRKQLFEKSLSEMPKVHYQLQMQVQELMDKFVFSSHRTTFIPQL